MENNWLELFQNKNQLAKVIETNQYTEQFGLTLLPEDAELILENRKTTLREQHRVEFGEGIVPKLIHEFCDSDYINQSNYVDTIIRLQEIFYLYKNEMNDEITDDELLHLMKEQYELLCFGDLDNLENTCLSEAAERNWNTAVIFTRDLTGPEDMYRLTVITSAGVVFACLIWIN